MRKIDFALAWLICSAGSLRSVDAALTVYPAPAGAALNGAFTVKVREPGGSWQDLAEYTAQIDMHQKRNTSFVYFDCSGPVEVSVTRNNGGIQTARVRPLSYGISPAVSGNTLTFTLPGPKKVSLEVNGDMYQNLQVFANPPEVSPPSPMDPNVIYLGPGIHTGNQVVGSGKTLYLAGGAILRGGVIMNNVRNARLMGHGIIDHPSPEGVQVDYSDGVEIDGVIIVDSPHYTVYCGQTDNLTIRNLKAFSSVGWSDGLDMMSCSDVTIDDVFMRTSDDAIAIYGHRWGFYGNVHGIKVTNSSLWADVAHPINIGTHGDTRAAGDTIEDLAFTNLDILQHDEPQVDYQGTMAFSDGDKNLIRRVRFENIRVEDFDRGQLVNLKVVYNTKYNTAPGAGIEDIYYKDISYNGTGEGTSQIAGYDAARLVKGVTFENLRVNGKLILDAAAGNIKIGSFTQDIRFIPSTGSDGSPVSPPAKLDACAPGIQSRAGGLSMACPCAGGYSLELLGGDGKRISAIILNGPGNTQWSLPARGGAYIYRFRMPGGKLANGLLRP